MQSGPAPEAQVRPWRDWRKHSFHAGWDRDLNEADADGPVQDRKALWVAAKQALARQDMRRVNASVIQLEELGETAPRLALRTARAFLGAGRPDGCLRVLRRLSPSEPAEAMLHQLLLSQALSGVGKPHEASSAFERALELGLAGQQPDLASRLARSFLLEQRQDASGPMHELAACRLDWGLADTAAGVLASSFRRGGEDGASEAAADVAFAVLRLASAGRAGELIHAMARLYEASPYRDAHRALLDRAPLPPLPEPSADLDARLLLCLAEASAALGDWRSAVRAFGALAPLRKQEPELLVELARCAGRDWLSHAGLQLAPPAPPKVFDLFPYNGEAEVLLIKLHEMAAWVDHFILVEARRTFTGRPKPIYFEEQRPLFSAFADKLVHVVVDDFPDHLDCAWAREFHQRDHAAHGLRGLAAPEDWVIISDADEVIDHRAFVQAQGDICGALLRDYGYFLNYERIRPVPLATVVLARARLLLANGASYLRLGTARFEPNARVADAGWHFSSIGTEDRLELKMRSYSHEEYSHLGADHFGALRSNVRSGQDLPSYVRRELDERFPDYIRANRETLAGYIL
jgi:hypothetical protein